MSTKETRIGDIYVTNCSFESIGITIHAGEVITIIDDVYPLDKVKVAISSDIESAKAKIYAHKWTLEKSAITTNCIKSVDTKDIESEPAIEVKKTLPRRMTQKQFMVALSEQ